MSLPTNLTSDFTHVSGNYEMAKKDENGLQSPKRSKLRFPSPSSLSGIAKRRPNLKTTFPCHLNLIIGSNKVTLAQQCRKSTTDYRTACFDRSRRKTSPAQIEKVSAGKPKSALKKRPSEFLPGGLYNGLWRPGLYYPVVILPWDDKRIDMKILPNCNCFDFDEDGNIKGWAPSYKDDGISANNRWFPILYIGKNVRSGWMHAQDFFEFDDKQLSKGSKLRLQYDKLPKYEPRTGQTEPGTSHGQSTTLHIGTARSWWDTVLNAE